MSNEFNSPACMLPHEAEPEPPGPDSGDWPEIRLWRKAKRAALIARRVALPAATRGAHDQAITAALMGLLPQDPGALIGFYWPFRGEYDARPLVRALHERGTALALPVVVERARPLQFRRWWPGVAMARGIWDIPVPKEGDPVAPDLLLAPLVGFDRARYRLGYGGGYYDRTVAAAQPRPKLVGVGYGLAQIATIYPQPHDVPMDLIVTENGCHQ